jgi:MinD-like ATPase involved in chromosome partitioning or flagellar assembly
MLKSHDRPRPAAQLVVIAVAGGAGSPGRTTVAMSLVAALGAAAPTVLVEADLSAPAIAAYLDRDPGRNICTLGHVVRGSPHAWSNALADELQVLTRHVPGAAVLCGLPKREMRSSVSPQFIERLVAELSARYRFVVLDVGDELLGADPAAVAHRAALAVAQHVLVVSGSDLIGLWHTRVVLKQLEQHLGISPEHMSLILNRHDPHHHHARSEIEWHLGANVAAVIPHDYAAAQRAIGEQRPLVLDPASRAGRAIVQLAERLHQGELRLPHPETAASTRHWWRAAWPTWLKRQHILTDALAEAEAAQAPGAPPFDAPVDLTAAAARPRAQRSRAW